MNLDLVIVIILGIVVLLLLTIFIKINNKSQHSDSIEIEKISKTMEGLLSRTIEQQGVVNSKITEIGELTKKMTNAMTANISDMGTMGEVILENILNDCGMSKGRDFEVQYSGEDRDGRKLRPDLVVFLPEKRNIIIDSKVSMKDWYEFQNTDNENDKKVLMGKFISAIKNHITSLNKKDYTKILNINSPDYVFIFMPHEYAYVTAQKYDTNLANFAQQHQIIIVGPSTLIMCMKLVESIWRLEKQNKNSAQIAELAGGIFDQIAKTINLIDKSENGLIKTLENIVQLKRYMKEGKGSLLNKANQMKELGAQAKVKIENDS